MIPNQPTGNHDELRPVVASIRATEKAERDEVANGPAGDRVWRKIEQAAALPVDASRMAMVNRVESFQDCSRAKKSGLSSKSTRLTDMKGR
jgi:hypothetical protein